VYGSDATQGASALGIVVWPMAEFEADDALATGAARFKKRPGVEQVEMCSPDKDLAQSLSGVSVICWDRRRDILLDEEGVTRKFGVRPHSLPDWLALMGDAADGYPGDSLLGSDVGLRGTLAVRPFSSPSRKTNADLVFLSGARPVLWRAWDPTARRPFSTATWRLPETMFPSRKGSPILSGEVRGRS